MINTDQHDTPVFPDGTPLQIARWTAKRAFIAVIVTTDRVILPAGATIIELTATQDCFIAFGDNTVNAVGSIASDASRLFVTGVQAIVIPLDSSGVPFTHIAAIRDTADGTLQIEQLG